MPEQCWQGGPLTGWHRRMQRCPERALPNRIFCQTHFEEAMARVAMVSPVVEQTGLRWSGVPHGSSVGSYPQPRVSA
jgi:hypothetical protein